MGLVLDGKRKPIPYRDIIITYKHLSKPNFLYTYVLYKTISAGAAILIIFIFQEVVVSCP